MAQLFEALHYNPEGRGFDYRWCHSEFSLTYSFRPSMALGSTQPLIEISGRHIFCGVKAAPAGGWQPYNLRVLIVLKSGSLNLLEPSGPIPCCTLCASAMRCRRMPEPWHVRASIFCLLLSRSKRNRLWTSASDLIIPVDPGGTCESRVLADCETGRNFLVGWLCINHLRNTLHLKFWFKLVI